MSEQKNPCRTLISQLGADQVEEIENEKHIASSASVAPILTTVHIVTDQEREDRLLKMAESRVSSKTLGRRELPTPAGAVGICAPKAPVWIRPFMGTERVSADNSFRVQIVGEQYTDSRVERRLFTQTMEEFSSDTIGEWRDEIIEVATARERATPILDACNEIDGLARNDADHNRTGTEQQGDARETSA